jgi:hypothetical protein
VPACCQACYAPATHRLVSTSDRRWYCYRCDEHTAIVRDGLSSRGYTYESLEETRPHAPDTCGEMSPMIAEGIKSATVNVKRPDFECRVSRGARGIMLYVRSVALAEHLRGLSEGRVSVNASGRSLFSVPMSRLRVTSLFTISDVCTALLMDAGLADGHEVKIMDVMNAPAAKDYVRDLMAAFTEYVRDYMSALCVTGTVTIDETVIRKSPIVARGGE